MAVTSFHTEYGVYPPGDTLAITQALKGANVRQLIFIEFSSTRTAPDGAWLDPWGTPYRIDYPSPESTRMISAGPDREFGTADDIKSTRPPHTPPPSR